MATPGDMWQPIAAHIYVLIELVASTYAVAIWVLIFRMQFQTPYVHIYGYVNLLQNNSNQMQRTVNRNMEMHMEQSYLFYSEIQ